MRVAVVVSHPIQHFCPQYRSWAAIPGTELRVFFGSSLGSSTYYDVGFGREISWGHGILDGFDSVFLDRGANAPRDGRPGFQVLGHELKRFRPDVVIVYGYAQALQRLALGWCLRSRTPVAYVSDSEPQQVQSAARKLAKKLVLSRLFARIDTFLTVGDANEAYYQHMGVAPGKFIRMHFPIDRELYDAAYRRRDEIREAKRRSLGVSEDEILIAMVGKLVATKAQGDLIRGAQAAASLGLNIKLILVGSGPMAEEYARDSEGDQVTSLLGFIPPGELPAFYAASDVYVHASAQDPHPLAVSEAAAMACPLVVSSAVGSWGPTDDLSPFVNGFVFSSGSVAQLAGALALLARLPGLRHAYGAVSRERSVGFQRRAHFEAICELEGRLF
jgi:glycosyltransferase involved in cell wall biosynthesis